MTETEIRILQMVYFKTNKATIQQESFPILDEVAQVLKGRPARRRRYFRSSLKA